MIDMASKNNSQKTPKKEKVKKVRWYHQVAQAYKMTADADRRLPLYVFGIPVLIVALAFVLGFIWGGGKWGQIIYALVLGIPFAALAGMFILARRAEKTQYKKIEGQPGAARAALGTIQRGWTFEEEPVAVDPKTRELIFRGVGRPGIILVTEGNSGRLARLIDSEKRKLARVVPGVPVTVIQSGRGEGQVPLPELAKTVKKLKKKITKAELFEVNRRLNTLSRLNLPIPKGIDPNKTRIDRKGIRGR